MRFNIKNELKETDYKRLVEFLKDAPSVSIELFSGLDLDFTSVSPTKVVVEGFNYKMKTEIVLKEPIGFEVYASLKLSDELTNGLQVNRRNFRLSRIVVEPTDFEKALNIILRTVELIVNHLCHRFGWLIEQPFTINSEGLDKQLDMMFRKKELKERDEIPRPFGTIHAKNAGDAKERVGELVPVYMERDKAYLYEDKKIFMLLPRNFAMKLLRLEGPTLMPVDQFTEEEREALTKFSMRQYIKTRKVGGKVHYSDLDETTRKLLLIGMKKRSF